MKTTTKTHIYYVEHSWTYNNQPFVDDSDNFFGFIYCITNKRNGMWYIGKKLFTMAGYKQIKGKRKKIRKYSGWKDYYGSGPRLQKAIEQDGKENFSREILRLCVSRGECNYWELYEIISRHALRRVDSYNDWVKVTIGRNHLVIGENEYGSKS